MVPNSEYGFLETHPQPAADVLEKYYESEQYISHTDSKKGVVSFLYQVVKKYSLRKKLRLVSKLNSGEKTILDIGAGTGEFLKLAFDQGWKVSGVEPNKKARTFAKSKKIALVSSMEEIEDRKFDVVTLWHVLEHLPDLETALEKIEGFLKPNGTLVIAVPNFNSFDANYYKKFWAAYDVPRHLWHFSRESMHKLFSPKLELQEIRPMVFDAFYVSLLSEKYKTKRSFSLKALWIGWRSNWKARRTREYSSLIYCYNKKN